MVDFQEESWVALVLPLSGSLTFLGKTVEAILKFVCKQTKQTKNKLILQVFSVNVLQMMV